MNDGVSSIIYIFNRSSIFIGINVGDCSISPPSPSANVPLSANILFLFTSGYVNVFKRLYLYTGVGVEYIGVSFPEGEVIFQLVPLYENV